MCIRDRCHATNSLSKLSNLVSLDIEFQRHHNLSDLTLDSLVNALRNCPKISRLEFRLWSPHITDGGLCSLLGFLPNLPVLRDLVLNLDEISDERACKIGEVLSFTTSLSRLKIDFFRSNNIGNQAMNSFSKMFYSLCDLTDVSLKLGRYIIYWLKLLAQKNTNN
eukprot:TRINITY_DN25400_c0_g1_i3.p1 TRINITY_DN25400_c0_g1~~TRINITY_DN25400_c0_g1_i3.p1  ORF type:complete len:165 (+),score=3.73 TRINITY_DN25400_c0_g1_i3:64-558(+)